MCNAATGGASLCSACHADLPWNGRACRRCGVALAAPEAVLCGHCLRTPPPFDAALCAFQYRFPIDRLLVKLKFHAQLGYARILGDLIAERIDTQAGLRPDVIVPVPLHPNRIRQRGFNQATEIARALGARLELPVATNLCVRRRATEAQSSLAAAARRRNLRGAFAATSRRPPPRVAIVDDVVTTGATAAELARTLRAAGARTVLLWSAARA